MSDNGKDLHLTSCSCKCLDSTRQFIFTFGKDQSAIDVEVNSPEVMIHLYEKYEDLHRSIHQDPCKESYVFDTSLEVKNCAFYDQACYFEVSTEHDYIIQKNYLEITSKQYYFLLSPSLRETGKVTLDFFLTFASSQQASTRLCLNTQATVIGEKLTITLPKNNDNLEFQFYFSEDEKAQSIEIDLRQQQKITLYCSRNVRFLKSR